MSNIHSPMYDNVRNTVHNQLNNSGGNWEFTYNAGKLTRSLAENLAILKEFNMISEDITEDIWIQIVQDIQQAANETQNIEMIRENGTILSYGEDNRVKVPEDERSTWQLYRQHLLDSGFRREAVDNIEQSTLKILKKLNNNTVETEPVKGLVIGQVQSGKTASMAALMAMASDWGWNTFIVLSGMIENLRKQTENRLTNDLNHNGNNTWIPLSGLSGSSSTQHQQNLILDENAYQRYLYVCLKNKKRLEDLIDWITSDKNKLRQMKILVIDDESDQASVNTKDTEEERAKINELIVKLVNTYNKDHISPRAMNYVCYTATPYANFLNESSKESLYPKDFIAKLPVSEEYIGPKQIFGYSESDDFPGMDIVRSISEKDYNMTKNIQEGETYALPYALKESISWFLIGTSIMRYYNYKKPVSMLVHTSQKQYHHRNVANAIDAWITNTSNEEIVRFCSGLYDYETNRFNIDKFREANKNYPVPNDQLKNYPYFTQIRPFIEELIQDISYIKMGEEGELKYHNNIHLCIDNSANNGINEENMHIRLAYPDKNKLQQLDKAPAFIVVGGSTLSRGLTLEGLLSTYFLRGSNTGDTLMQMGRWFGYKHGYELLPRIWMTDNTFEKFEFLTSLEEELRDELEEFEIDNKMPLEFGPRVKNTPKVSWLRVTSKNKMQNAEEVDMDFTGNSLQTIHFENDERILRYNIDVAENFLENICSSPQKSLVRSSSVFFENIDFESIKNEFLLKMQFSERSRGFNQIEAFCEWYDKVKDEMEFNNWNVIIGGSGEVAENNSKNNTDSVWNIGPYAIGKVTRSVKSRTGSGNNETVNIGVLRAPDDLYADIKNRSAKDEINQLSNKASKRNINKIRNKYGISKTPQLIIYRIDKNSEAYQNKIADKYGTSQQRSNLEFQEDIIGIALNIPGSDSSKPMAKGLRVKIKTKDVEEE